MLAARDETYGVLLSLIESGDARTVDSIDGGVQGLTIQMLQLMDAISEDVA